MRTALLCIALACVASFAAAANPINNVDVFGSIRGTKGTFSGKFKITQAVKVNNMIHFVGTISRGQLVKAGGSKQSVPDIIMAMQIRLGKRKLLAAAAPLFGSTMPLTGITARCDLLELDIGAVHINLLGVTVDLNSFHLDVAPKDGKSGSALGKQLCSIANLLNGAVNIDSLLSKLNTLIKGLNNGSLKAA